MQTLLAGQIGLGGEMPAYMIAEGRHAPCMLAFQTLQAGRTKLEGMKRAHLRREVRFHEVVLHASARAVRDADDENK